MPKIIVTAPGGGEDYSYPCDEPEMSIGRLPSNAIVLAAANVSRHHAKLLKEGVNFFLIDLGSDNGTTVNANAIRANERYLLRDGDLIGIGDYRLHFYGLDATLEQSFNEITDSDIMEVKLLKKVLRALDKETLPSLEVLNGAAEGKKVFFEEGLDTLTIGRDPMVDLPIEEYVISRRHAKFVRRPDGIVVHDLGSKNGTYVNNDRVTEMSLHDGDRVAFGTIVTIFRNPRDLNIEAVSKRLKEHRQQVQSKRAAATPEPPPSPPSPSEAPERIGEEFGGEASESTGTGTDELSDVSDISARERAHDYPTPQPATKHLNFSAMEIGLLWAGTVVFLVTVVLLVRLLT